MDNHRGHNIRVNKKISSKQTWKLAMRWANMEMQFSGRAWKSAHSVKEGAHQITKAGRDSKWIINSFLSIIIGISLAHSWERGQKIESVLCRSKLLPFSTLIRCLCWNHTMGNHAGMQRSTYGHYLYAHLPLGAFVFEICLLASEAHSGCLFSLCCHLVSLFRQIKRAYLISEVFSHY